MSEGKMFLVAVDSLIEPVDATKIKALLKTSPLFGAWWHHIPGCFLLTSASEPEQIANEFRTVTGDACLLVIAVDPARSEGWLPERSWEWIRRREPEHAE